MRPNFFIAALLAVALLWNSAGAADAPLRAVTSSALTPEGGRFDPREVAEALTGAGVAAVAVPVLPQWNAPVTGKANAHLLRIVNLAFGERGDVFAFTLGDDGTLGESLHLGYDIGMAWGKKVWQPPVGLLAETLATVTPEEFRLDGARPADIVVTPWTTAPTADDDLLDDEPAAPGLASGLAPGPAAPAAPHIGNESLDPFTALAWGMAARAGWRPTPGAAERIGLTVRRGFHEADFGMVLRAGDGTVSGTLSGVSEARFAVALEGMFRMLRQRDRIGAIMILAPDESPVGVAANKLIVTNGTRTRAFDRASGAVAWTLGDADGAARHLPGGIVLIGKTASLLDAERGRALPLAPLRVLPPHARLLADGTLLTLEGSTCHAYRKSALAWSHDTGTPLTAGPVADAERVMVADASGTVWALALASGVPVWSAPLPPPVRGARPERLALVDNRLYVAWTRGDTLTTATVSADSLAPGWTLAVGDRVLSMPEAAGGAVVLTGKNNRILRVDPADGRILAERVWPVWLVGTAVTGSVLVTDMDGTLSWLSPETLEPRQTLALGARPHVGPWPFAEPSQDAGEAVQALPGGTAFVVRAAP